MNINRNNYEEFFMMYLDNELSHADKQAVENFITENNDLKQELDLLRATILPAEQNVFIPKTLLYRDATASGCVEETLLLHLDNELSEKDIDIVNAQINADKNTADEWKLLQSTKLDPSDIISFPFKNTLYRHTGRVMPIKWWRAAAAVLIGILMFTSLYVVLDSGSKPVVDVAGNSNSQSGKSSELPLQVNKGNNYDSIALNKGAEIYVAESPKVSEEIKPLVNAVDNKIKVDKENFEKKSNYQPLVNVKQPENKQDGQVNEVSEDREMIIAKTPEIVERKMEVIDREITKVTTPVAMLTSNEETSDKVLYMEEDKVTRSMWGGILRKVKRVVERNTKIKTPNNLRIGGYEFAIK